MQALSKPISSPGRTGNFQPPLMKFMRGHVGSKSSRKGKSRSSPIFYIRRKRNSARAIETIQEPSSPKVTCIGQVRASRSRAATVSRRRRRPCWLLKKTKTLFSVEKSSRLPNRVFGRWGLFFGSGYYKKGAETGDSCRVYNSNQKSERPENILDDCNDRNTPGGSSCPVRRNEVVVLTRCRSAPYRPSSLGGLFWGSVLFEGVGENGTENDAELKKPNWENSRNEQESNSMKFESLLVSNFQELKGNAGGAVHPLLLTRCKSEPARRLVAV